MSLIYKIKRKAQRQLKEKWFDISFYLFKSIPKSIKDQRGLRVIIYHGICKKDPHKFNSRFLSEVRFESQLKVFQRCFNMISLSDYKNKNFSGSKLNVLVTFDDGYRNNFSLALPLLEKYKVPAVFFVTALPADQSYLFNDVLDVFSLIGPANITLRGTDFQKRKTGIHYRYLNNGHTQLAHFFHALNQHQRNEILKEIYAYVPKETFQNYSEFVELLHPDDLKGISGKNFVTIGSHGVSHVDLSCVELQEAKNELEQSRKTLSAITLKEIDCIAFPYGNYDRDIIAACKEVGYTDLFGTEKINDPNDRATIVERITANPFVSAINQAYYISKNRYD